MTLKRMDNVLIVVDDLEAVKAFFIELGLRLEGETTVEGPLVGKLIGLKDVRATLAMMRTPDGQGNEPNIGKLWRLTNEAGDLVTVEAGEPDIEQNDIGPEGFCGIDYRWSLVNFLRHAAQLFK